MIPANTHRFGIRLKPQMDEGNFILRPTFSLALLARVSAPSNGNMQRWRFLVIRDPKVKETTARYHADTLPTIVLLDSDGKVAVKIDH